MGLAFLLVLATPGATSAMPPGYVQPSLIDAAASGKRERLGLGTDSAAGDLTMIRVTDPRSPSFGSTFCIVELPGRTFRIGVRAVGRSGNKRSVYAQAAGRSSLAVITGGPWRADGKGGYTHAGLVVADGRTIAPFASRAGGAITVRNGVAAIEPARGLSRRPGVDQAVWSQPMLVENGASGMRARDRDRYDRLAIGLRANGDLVIVGVFSPDGRGATLWDLAEYLRRPATAGGLGVKEGLALDGSYSAFMYFPRLRRSCGAEVEHFVPNVISIDRADR